jgi:hypothetical protein
MTRLHPKAAPKKPQGQPTRGKTARNRLRRVDTFLACYDPALIRREWGAFAGAWLVDLGYGAEPFTTLEMAQRLRRINPGLRVLGVEIDAERVSAALPFADEQTEFRLGGFNLPLQTRADGRPETVRAVRAFNVLRQYEEQEVAPAYALLAQSILPGGLLIEGTSDPLGRVWVANVLRKPVEGVRETPLVHEALVFSGNLRAGFDPGGFQAVLPKNLIHRVVPGEAIHCFFDDWRHAAQVTSPLRAWGVRQWFVAAAHALAQCGWPINLHHKWLRKGFVVARWEL